MLYHIRKHMMLGDTTISGVRFDHFAMIVTIVRLLAPS